jgi:hypothetical protein
MMLALWLPLNLLVIALTGLYAVAAMRRVAHLATGFLILAIFARYSSASLSDYTVAYGIGGLSFNALASLAIIAGGVFLIPPRTLALRALWPFHISIAVCIVSAALNRAPGPGIGVLLNWAYMLIIALLIRRAIRQFGAEPILRLLFPIFAMPVVLGLLSYLVGFQKFSSFDNSTSYIGGFIHEANYSVIVYTSLLVSLLIKWRSATIKVALVLIAVVTIFLANYRTTVLALLPLMAIVGLSTFHSVIPQRFRVSALLVGAVVTMLSFSAIIENIPERYGELLVILGSGGVDITTPTLMTESERMFFSARLYIWSLYLNDYSNGDLAIRLFGFGPGTFENKPYLLWHAHNNYISDLHQIGILGLVALLLLHFNVIVRAALLPDRHYARTLIAGQIGLMIIGLATTPFNNIEGLITYAVLLGVTLGVTPPPSDVAQPQPVPGGSLARVSAG